MSETGDRPTSRRAFAVAAAGGLALAATLAGRATAVPDAEPDDAITNALAAPPGSNATAPPAPASPPPAPPPPAPPPPTVNTPARARDLGKLSNIIYNNPSERALFLADPSAYAVRLGLRNISAADLAAIRTNVADGFCCMGCGC